MKELQPLSQSTELTEEIEAEISKLFREEIYLPLVQILDEDANLVSNSDTDPLVSAIKSGRLTFYRGQFRGRFNAKVALALKKLGAKWDKKQGCFTLKASSLPTPVRDAIEVSKSKLEKVFERIQKTIDKMVPEKIADQLKIGHILDSQIYRVDSHVEEQLQGITVTQKLTKDQRAKIAEEYTNNMKLYIKDWTEKEIVNLREKMRKNVQSGVRYDDMIETIQKRYDVSESKARFLARQETNLLTTTMQKERYKAAGVGRYKWQCVVGSPNHPVRHSHKVLDGKIFSWDNPPVTDEKGNRNHPGQDFGCRCKARPIVEF